MAGGDDYRDLQQPTDAYDPTGGAGASNANYADVQKPPSAYQQKAVVEDDPIELVKADLKAVNRGLPQGTSLIDMVKHPNGVAFKDVFTAWTDSSESIFINLWQFDEAVDAADPAARSEWRASALIGVVHELVHVAQFKKHGGHPKTFQLMISYEVAAYENTVTFIDNAKNREFLLKAVNVSKKVLDGIRGQFAAAKKDCAAEAKLKLKSDDDYRQWLIKKKLLPGTIQGKTDYTLADLYLDTKVSP